MHSTTDHSMKQLTLSQWHESSENDIRKFTTYGPSRAAW